MKKTLALDASTTILLAKISLLREVTKRMDCYITNIVEGECTRKDTDDARLIKDLVREGAIRLARPNIEEAEKLTRDFNMADGESSSLVLAREKKCILATDDRQTIKACTALNIPFLTAVHFVIRAHEKGLIGREIALEKMAGLEKFGRYDRRIIDDARKRINGDKNGGNS